MPNAQAEAIKGEGNAFFKAGKYAEAIEKYNAATAIDASVPAYWSNMAACHEKLGNYEKMGEAARSCIKADKNFAVKDLMWACETYEHEHADVDAIKGFPMACKALYDLELFEETDALVESGTIKG